MDVELLKIVIDDCNDFINALAKKIKNKTDKINAKMKISRMKQKIDKYFMYISKNNDDNTTQNIIKI
jgi:site-specific recombinase